MLWLPPHLSLTRRLIIAAAVVMVLSLSLTALLLDRVFVNSQVADQSERLFIRVFNLLAIAEFDDSTLSLPDLLPEERFNSPESGLLALVLNGERQTIWESRSSQWFTAEEWLSTLPPLAAGEAEFGRYGNFVYQRNGFDWEDAGGSYQYFEFWVLETALPLNRAIQTFRSQLWGGLAAVMVVLLLTLSRVVAWGLHPLRRLVTNLNLIRSGDAQSLTGQYPQELIPLTDSLNRLLQAEQGQRERYRKAMGDLAHSLKTPLAVMRSQIDQQQTALCEQLERMQQIIRYQLQRAVTDARSGSVLGQHCDLIAALERLLPTLQKAFADQPRAVALHKPVAAVGVAMDGNDVLEVFGNLIENAYKYSCAQISIQVAITARQACIFIDDDGPGIPVTARAQIVTRGTKLDSLQPGQGIGLAIVSDILASYGTELRVAESPLGGARFALILPLRD